MKKLYHGTISDFSVVDIRRGKGYKDFGRGFWQLKPFLLATLFLW